MRWYFFPILFVVFDGCPSVRAPHSISVLSSGAFMLPQDLLPAAEVGSENFPYGIASGDPLADAVIIWSMLDTAAAAKDSLVVWQMSKTPAFKKPTSGKLTARTANRFSIKVDVTGLEPDTYYYYRFMNAGRWSETGRTRTLPAKYDAGDVKLAVVSCNALEWGYMNAFGRISDRNDLNAVVHLGDYIYEYASGVYGDTTLGRFHEPRHEIVTADDYHTRYAQYRRMPQLRAAHQQHPFICVWDDHEVANDSYLSGAENHNPEQEGDYLTRMTSAKQVYYNWMPIRESGDGAIYRRFRFGEMAELHMLDERLAGRDAPATSFDVTELADTSRRMLGEKQFNWLCEGLATSDARWQLLGNQVLFARLDLSKILPQYAVNLDAWDGYAYEQQRLQDSLKAYGNPNTIFLTGDTHCSWYFDIEKDDEHLAYELATPSVSSANYDELIGGWDTLTVARYRLYRDNDHLNYTNIKDHGYLLLDLKAEGTTAEFHYSESIRYSTDKERSVKTFNLPYDYPRSAR
ncbi:alkaline phosphatase [Neolewinella aurantiaca]|uniref:Alkaline phosphatase n=1 Tax=Neolewinella aurantiaca TaxID=2602767 RepID=A0A5C7FYD1_9BACT|nr:alkaline phosphatase D family protein [Neolewinella aurantiaca]TXF90093.1 alkaline phosphatase [Neolewinella aurantiaca]